MNLPKLKEVSIKNLSTEERRNFGLTTVTDHVPKQVSTTISRNPNFAVTTLSGISPMAMSILKNLYEKRDNSGVLNAIKKEPSIKFRSGPTNETSANSNQKDFETYILMGNKTDKGAGFKTVSFQKEYKPRKSPKVHRGSPTLIQKSFSIERGKSKEHFEYPSITKKNIFEATQDDVFQRKTMDYASLDTDHQESKPRVPKVATLVSHFPQTVYDLPQHKKTPPLSKEISKLRDIPQAYLIQKTIERHAMTLERARDKGQYSIVPSLSQEKLQADKSYLKITHTEKAELKPFLQKAPVFVENSAKKKIVLPAIDSDFEIKRVKTIPLPKQEASPEKQEVLVQKKEQTPVRVVPEPERRPPIKYNPISRVKRHKSQKSKNASMDSPSKKQVNPKSKTISKDAKREHLLYNLFLGISVNVKTGKQSAAVKFKFGVGTGNNDKLVERLLKARGLEFENFFSKCNLVWTQSTGKRTAVATLGVGVADMDLQDNNTPQKVRAFKIKSAEALEKQIIDLRLFKVSDDRLVSEIALFLQERSRLTVINAESFTMLNHIKGLKYISRKHLLFGSIKKYCEKQKIPLESVVPQTWVLHGDKFDEELDKMISEKLSSKSGFKHPLIIKPGENSNRGQGITLAYTAEEAIQKCKDVLESRKNTSTVVVQEYISNPLLFLKRKFDIRCYALVHRLPGRISYFWYNVGYARTCSQEYSTDCKDNLMVHLTNEGVQVKGRLM